MSKWITLHARIAALVLAGLAGSASYVVQPGDTLSAIAGRFGTGVEHLVAINGLASPDRIFAGQVLRTGSDAAGGGAARESTHVVRPGETLSGIAEAHGVDAHTLTHANGIVGDRVAVGTRLQLERLPVDFAPLAIARSHVVAAGESLPSIARNHGTTTARLLALNHLHEGESLEPGRIVTVTAGWQCPVPSGRFVNDWGWVKPDGRTHEGIDLFAPRGSAIVAPVAGHLHQQEGAIGGLQFTLWGHDGVRYFGSHLESVGAAGDVHAGQTIGTVGSSGNAAGSDPHLHFEAYPGDGVSSANPYPALLASCRPS